MFVVRAVEAITVTIVVVVPLCVAAATVGVCFVELLVIIDIGTEAS